MSMKAKKAEKALKALKDAQKVPENKKCADCTEKVRGTLVCPPTAHRRTINKSIINLSPIAVSTIREPHHEHVCLHGMQWRIVSSKVEFSCASHLVVILGE